MLPVPVLDDKTFAQLIDDAKKQIPRFAPEWTDFNIHDPGVTFIELFAWLTEGQRYYLDQVRDEHVRKYLKLLGTAPLPPQPARAEVMFSVTGTDVDADVDEPRIPLGTQLAAGDTVFETGEDITVTASSIVKIVTLSGSTIIDQTEASGHEGLTFMAFGDNAETGSSLYLGFDRPFRTGLNIPVTFRLYDDYPVPICGSPVAGLPDVTPPVKLVWEYWDSEGTWKPLHVKRDETIMFTRSGRIWFEAPANAGHERLFPVVSGDCWWFRCTVAEDGYELVPRVDSILLNTVSVIQLASRSEYIGRSNGLGGQSFQLSTVSVLPSGIVLEVRESDTGEEGWIPWELVDDFDASGPNDRHFVLESGTGTVKFGDGIQGMVPPSVLTVGDNLRIRYRTTGGAQGNAGTGAISRFVDESGRFAKLRIDHFTPAIGGTAAEQLDEAVLRSGKELKDCTRAVTDDDFETLALATPGLRVARAKAIPLGESGNAVAVAVVPYGSKPNPQPSRGFIDTVYRHLDRHRLITTQVKVIAPDYVKVKVYALVSVTNGHDGTAVQRTVSQALSMFLHPLQGGAQAAGWPFGRTVYLSELYALIDRLQGVDSVQRLQLFNTGGKGMLDDQGNLVMDSNGLAFSDMHQIDIELPSSGCPAEEGGRDVRIGSK